jgi:ascorbate-specific PTS system EIIC-type component UlaA
MFGQAIVDAVFVKKKLKFLVNMCLVLISRCTNFYEIPISGDNVMPEKQFFQVMWTTLGSQKTFYFLWAKK